MGSKFIDRFNRPCGVISLRSLERTEERTLDECKEYIVASMEIVRRRICQMRFKYEDQKRVPHIAEGDNDDEDDEEAVALVAASGGPLQMIIAFDLQSSSMSNLELELLPFLLDLLKNHFPGMVSAVFVLHYGWVHAGMWGIAKRILPAQALAKIFFPSEQELCNEHFSSEVVPEAFGGKWGVKLDQGSNDCLNQLGRPDAQAVGWRGGSAPSSPSGSHSIGRKSGLSRTGSFESLADSYFSAAGTPRAASRSHTPRQSGPPTPRGDGGPHGSSAGSLGLQLTANAARKLRELQMTRGATSAPRHRWRAERSGFGPIGKGADRPEKSQTSTSTLCSTRSLRDFRLLESMGSSNMLLPDSSSDENDDDAGHELNGDSAKSGKVGETTASSIAPATASDWPPRGGKPGFLKRWTSGANKGREGTTRPQGETASFVTAEYAVDVAPVPSNGESPLSSSQLRVQGLSWHVPIADIIIGSGASQFSEGNGEASDAPRFLSLRRSRKYDRIPGAVSPYNSSNPFWGYPAYFVPSAIASSTNLAGLSQTQHAPADATQPSSYQGPSPHSNDSRRPFGLCTEQDAGLSSRSFRVDGSAGRHRHMRVKRCWRDLFRTLSYLFVLRILALHRQARWKIAQVARASASLVRLSAGRLLCGSSISASSTSASVSASQSTSFTHYQAVEEEERKWQEATERHRKLRAASFLGRPRILVHPREAGGHLRSQGTKGIPKAVIIFMLAWWLASGRIQGIVGGASTGRVGSTRRLLRHRGRADRMK